MSNASLPHRAARNLERDLMYRDRDGAVCSISSSAARTRIKSAGSMRALARELGVPKSTLHDLVRDKNKLSKR